MKFSILLKPMPAVLLGIVMTVFSTATFGLDPPPFELDGDAVADGLPGTDWDVINLASDSGLTVAETDLIIDYNPEPNEAQFHGGNSKDELDITGWGWRTGSPPAKDDLTNAYAAAFEYDGDFHVVFGMDRYDTSGSAQLGFWFLQDTAGPVPGGSSGDWTGEHKVGDLLVLVNFTNGGDIPTIEAYAWDGTTAVQISAPDAALCSGGWIPSGKDHCGITNPTAVFAPWTYYHKDLKGISSEFPPGGFFEGAINLSALGLNDVCFTTFMAESRSSASITAVLKDFALGGFPVCSISVTKYCKNPRLNAEETLIIYDIMGKVTNDGFGTVYDVDFTDAPPADGDFFVADCTSFVPSTTTFPIDVLDDACYYNTIRVPIAQNGPSDTVTASAWTASEGGTQLTATAPATCPPLQINPAFSVDKKCRAIVEEKDGYVVAKVEVKGKVCNTGDTGLSAVKVEDENIDTNPDPLLSGISLATGECKDFAGSYYPDAADDKDGNLAECASDVLFKDSVRADANNIFGNAITPTYNAAECNLCTDCPEYHD